jgi:hypothetical protein
MTSQVLLALKRLPDALRSRVEGHMVLHLWERNSRAARLVERAATVQGHGAVHPVICESPLSGVEVLGVTHILSHRWKTGDLVLWDNIALQHSRGAGPIDGRWRLRRTTFGIEGYEHFIREVHGSPSP